MHIENKISVWWKLLSKNKINIKKNKWIDENSKQNEISANVNKKTVSFDILPNTMKFHNNCVMFWKNAYIHHLIKC